MKNINDSYYDLYLKKDNSYGKIDTSLPAVVFIDGVGVTRNHKKYNLIQRNGYLMHLHKSAVEMVKTLGISCTVYTALDEVSFIFHDAAALVYVFEMGNTVSYIESLFIQKFSRIFWTKYPEINHKVTIFNIGKEEPEKWLQYRRAVCHTNAAVYMAKEYLDKEEYYEKDIKEVLSALKKYSLYENMICNRNFYHGILYKNTIMDFESGQLNDLGLSGVITV